MGVKRTSPLDWQKDFDKWWGNHSKFFIINGDGHQVDAISPTNEDEEDLARAAARSAYFHVYHMWKNSELMRASEDARKDRRPD